jgi:hypothetical protein
MQIQSVHQLEIPPQLRHKLESYRRRVWIVKLLEGILAGCFGLLISYLIVFLLDRLWDTPAAVRLLLLLGGSLTLGLTLPLKWHRWVWRTRRLEQAARLLRHRFPRIGDQLLGIVELARNSIEQERSESLCRAAMRQVDQQVRQYEFKGAVPRPRHRHWGWAVGVAVALAASVLLVVPAAGTNALVRWLFPWRTTERYTFAQLEPLPSKLVVPYAEPFSLEVQLASGSPWMPRAGRARYGEQLPIEAPLRGAGYRFEVPPQKQTGSLKIDVGDARQRIHVAPTARPELTRIMAQVQLPDYLQYQSYPIQDVRSGSLSVVRGSEVAVGAQTTRKLRRAMLGHKPLETGGDGFRVPSMLIGRSRQLELRWTDVLGLSAKEPFRLAITPVDDQAPRVDCAELEREQVVLSTETVSFEVLAHDDFGIKSVGMQWKGIEHPLRNPDPAEGEQVVALGEPERKELQAVAAFSTERLDIQPQSLELRVFALDFLPGRKRTYSSTYVLHVLSPEQHAIWLTRQLRKWQQRAHELYEHEERLYEQNKALRALEPEQLDRPPTRRRIQAQAAAEQNSARQLDALTRSGAELLELATRNAQFNVATLENWAETLQTLKEIAENRMPSVADLLDRAARAPGAQPPAPKREVAAGATSPAAPQVGTNRDPRTAPAGKQQPASAKAKVPGISDIESGFNQLDGKPSAKSKPGAPALKLPTTTVLGGGRQQQGDGASCPAQEKLEQAVAEQEELLAEFAKVAQELKKLLGDLEGSTFVKRLKAASRRQLAVAGDLNSLLEDTFGKSRFQVDRSERERVGKLAEQQRHYADQVYVIQDDLEAYYNRIRQGKFRTVHREMESTAVVSHLQGLAEMLADNLQGQSIAESEYWGDTLDRWAEQLVGPG